MISFRVDHEPVPQPRARHTSRGGFSRAYVPVKHPVHRFKSLIVDAYKQSGGKRFDGAVRCDVVAVFGRPKNKIWKRRPMLAFYHDHTCDADNIAKSVMDALNGHAWKDDSQVSYLTCQKIVAGEGYESGVSILIRSLDGEGELYV